MIKRIIFISGSGRLDGDIGQLVGEIYGTFTPPPIVVYPNPADAIGKTEVKTVVITEPFKIQDSVNFSLNVSEEISFICGICGSKISSVEKHKCILEASYLPPEGNTRLEKTLQITGIGKNVADIMWMGTKILKNFPAEKLFKWVQDARDMFDQ